jgi:hypothetical protein
MNKLIVYHGNNGPNQKFRLKNAGNGKFQIFCAKNGLTIESSNNAKGAKIYASEPNNQQNEFWEFVPVPSTNQKFQGKHAFGIKGTSGRFMDIEGGNAANDADICEWDGHGGDNQVWIIEPTN